MAAVAAKPASAPLTFRVDYVQQPEALEAELHTFFHKDWFPKELTLLVLSYFTLSITKDEVLESTPVSISGIKATTVSVLRQHTGKVYLTLYQSNSYVYEIDLTCRCAIERLSPDFMNYAGYFRPGNFTPVPHTPRYYSLITDPKTSELRLVKWERNGEDLIQKDLLNTPIVCPPESPLWVDYHVPTETLVVGTHNSLFTYSESALERTFTRKSERSVQRTFGHTNKGTPWDQPFFWGLCAADGGGYYHFVLTRQGAYSLDTTGVATFISFNTVNKFNHPRAPVATSTMNGIACAREDCHSADHSNDAAQLMMLRTESYFVPDCVKLGHHIQFLSDAGSFLFNCVADGANGTVEIRSYEADLDRAYGLTPSQPITRIFAWGSLLMVFTETSLQNDELTFHYVELNGSSIK